VAFIQFTFDDLPPTPGPLPEEMDAVTAAVAMFNRFTDQWGVTTPFRLDNEQYEPTPADTVAWVDITILPMIRRQSTLGRQGNRLFFHRDMFRAVVSYRKDSGWAPCGRLADQLAKIFEGYRNGGLYVTDVTPRRLGNDGQWFRIVVEVAFNYHEMQ